MVNRTRNETEGTVPGRDGVCPLEELIKVIGRRKVIILWHALAGPQRFAKLHRQMPGRCLPFTAATRVASRIVYSPVGESR